MCHFTEYVVYVALFQVSFDSDEEKDTESTLTTLFPGQKKRVSHFVAKGNVSSLSSQQ